MARDCEAEAARLENEAEARKTMPEELHETAFFQHHAATGMGRFFAFFIGFCAAGSDLFFRMYLFFLAFGGGRRPRAPGKSSRRVFLRPRAAEHFQGVFSVAKPRGIFGGIYFSRRFTGNQTKGFFLALFFLVSGASLFF